MDNECRDRLLKIIPMLGSDNDGEVLASVAALQRVLKVYKLTFHDLAAAITATTTAPPKKKKTESPIKNGDAWKEKTWTHNTVMPPINEIIRVCELFRMINSPGGQDASFMNQVYMDINILKQGFYMSQTEVTRFEEIKRRYNL